MFTRLISLLSLIISILLLLLGFSNPLHPLGRHFLETMPVIFGASLISFAITGLRRPNFS